jgi:hypothetical protein
MATYSTDFNTPASTENPLSTPFEANVGSAQRYYDGGSSNGYVVALVGGAVVYRIQTSGTTFTANQKSRITIGADPPHSSSEIGATCRNAAAGTETYYGYIGNTSASRIVRVNAGVVTDIITGGPAIANGDTMEIEATGTGATVTLTARRNGSDVLTDTDTDADRITSGQPGFRLTGGESGGINALNAEDVAVRRTRSAWLVASRQQVS